MTERITLEGALDICALYFDSQRANKVPDDEPVCADSFSNAELRLIYDAAVQWQRGNHA